MAFYLCKLVQREMGCGNLDYLALRKLWVQIKFEIRLINFQYLLNYPREFVSFVTQM